MPFIEDFIKKRRLKRSKKAESDAFFLTKKTKANELDEFSEAIRNFTPRHNTHWKEEK